MFLLAMRDILSLINKIGKVPLCNGKPERAPHIGGFCFPLCWRCISIIVGCWIMCMINTPFFIQNPYIGLIVSIIMVVPCLIDGISQYFFGHSSTNRRRAITGFLAGGGLVLLSDSVFGLTYI